MRAHVLIVSPETAFAASIGRRLQRWGLSVALESDHERVRPAVAAGEQVDVLLLDVRRCDDGLLGWLSSLKRAVPALEVILLTLPRQIAVSIAAMRAGASAELSAPIDVETLWTAMSTALRRRNKRLERPRASLLARFQRAMSAATFAQAGEFDTAREILAGDDPPESGDAGAGDGRPARKSEGT